MANLKDVAREAGVSEMTVSRVVNNSGYVKDATRKEVEKAIKKLNYFPNQMGRSLSKNKVNTVAIMSPISYSIEGDAYYSRLIYGIESVLADYSYDILISTQRKNINNRKRDFNYLRPYMERKADALILIGADLSKKDIQFIQENKIPVCVIGDRPESPALDVVDCNNGKAFYCLLEEIYRRGHREIAFGGYEEENENIHQRYLAYRRFLEDKDLPFRDDYILQLENGPSRRHELFEEYQALTQKPSLVACSTDSYAIGMLMTAKKTGLRLPKDLSITGFDGNPLVEYTEPSILTMEQPLEDMGKCAARQILQRIKEPGKARETSLFEAELRQGESVAVLN